jgi:hypothetical protein
VLALGRWWPGGAGGANRVECPESANTAMSKSCPVHHRAPHQKGLA